MHSEKRLSFLIGLICVAGATQCWSQVTLTGTSYSQNFDLVGSALPVGWDVRTGATTSSLGTTATFNTSTVSWATATGQFANMASSDGHTGSETSGTQSGFTDRVIGIRQTGSFGDPGAAMDFNFNASTVTFSGSGTALSLSLQMLSVQTYSTTWSSSFFVDYLGNMV